MNDVIQNLQANATNGKENFCYINENELNAIKQLSKREQEEKEELQDRINKAMEYIKEEQKYRENGLIGSYYLIEMDLLKILKGVSNA